MNVTIKKIRDNVILFSEADERSSQEEWSEGLKKTCCKILCERRVVVISRENVTDVVSDDFLRVNEEWLQKAVKKTEVVKVKGKNYSIVIIDRIIAPLIEDLVVSQQFLFGNMHFIVEQSDSSYDDLISDVKAMLRDTTFREIPNIKSELITLVADGTELLWLNPNEEKAALFSGDFT